MLLTFAEESVTSSALFERLGSKKSVTAAWAFFDVKAKLLRSCIELSLKMRSRSSVGL